MMINKIIKIWRLLMLIVIISLTYSRETLAVLLIKSADLSDFDRYSLTQRLTGEVIRLDIYDVVERSEITQLFEEQKIQHSGAIDFTSAVELGTLDGRKMRRVRTLVDRVVSMDLAEDPGLKRAALGALEKPSVNSFQVLKKAANSIPKSAVRKVIL